LKAIHALSTNFGSMFNTVEERLDKINDDITNWKTSINDKISGFESTLEKNKELMDGWQKTIEFMDTTSKDVTAHAQSIDTTFVNTDLLFQQERVLTVKAFLHVEERLNILEREVKSFNVRVQGLAVPDGKNIKETVVNCFIKAVPELKKSHIEFVAKITVKPEEGKAPLLPILLIRFTEKRIRNKVFFNSKKHVFESKIVVKEDMIKQDYEIWSKAKPQMAVAFQANKKPLCRNGKLTINKEITEVDGVESVHDILQKAAAGSTLKIVRIPKTD